jgi:mRNA interferase RelE/StbE
MRPRARTDADMVRVELTDDALEDLRDLDGSARKIVLKALKKLEQAPDQYGQPLGSQPSGNLTGFRKLVVGRKAYRIIYWVDEDAESGEIDVVVVWVIAERAEDLAYQLALGRLRAMAHSDVATEVEKMLVAVWKH